MNHQRLPVHNINVSDSVFSDFSFFKQERNPHHDGAHEIIRWKDPRHTICSHTGPIDYLRNPGTQPCPLCCQSSLCPNPVWHQSPELLCSRTEERAGTGQAELTRVRQIALTQSKQTAHDSCDLWFFPSSVISLEAFWRSVGLNWFDL